jgi:predicted outer membrane repeat protein
MYAGEIFNNTAGTNGGGVYNKGNFTMHGGVISGNTAEVNGGGGVYDEGRFKINAGVISGNTASCGNDVYTYDGKSRSYPSND